MMAGLVRLTIDGREIEVPAGTLVIEAARRLGIGIPTFCYYEGLSLQGACRMCLVEVERAPKLQTSCTLPVAPGMVVRTDTPQVKEARRAMLEFLLANHPLDCPVCDKGGECELQDTVFAHGAAESRFTHIKHHVDERQWSPVVFYDKPRCILCYRCVRICDEGMGVRALGIVNRGVAAGIGPNRGTYLECDQCGMCIDICPVGALTSGIYRYRTRPWEMNHVGTICAHCADGCTTMLGVYGNRIMRGNNRDRSGLNGEFLCVKGRYAADFVDHPDRLASPLMRRNGRLEPVSWSEALAAAAAKFREVRERGGKFGVIASNHTTNEENAALHAFARRALGTENIDHHRTGDPGRLSRPEAKTADLYTARAVLIAAADLAQQHPLLSYLIRANHRHHGARVYTAADGPVREDKYSARRVPVSALESLRDELRNEPELVILFGDAVRVERIEAFGDSLGIPVKYVCLVDYSNSRGAAEYGAAGLTLSEMLAAGDLDVLWVVGANPLKNGRAKPGGAFLVVQELFPTETVQAADIVFPAASQYEKTGTVTNVCGEVQRLRQAISRPGVKTDLEIIRLLARHMGIALEGVEAVRGGAVVNPESARDTLFTSGTLGRYSNLLRTLREGR